MKLSPREQELAGLLELGYSNKEIAWRMRRRDTGKPLTEGTIKVYCHQLFHRLGLGTRGEFLHWWHSQKCAECPRSPNDCA